MDKPPLTDLHLHSQFSPCAENVTVEEDVKVALNKGLRVIAVTDHGTTRKPSWFKNYMREVQKVRDYYSSQSIVVLTGMEVDVLEDGSLAVSDDILKKLDIIVASLHRLREYTPEEWRKRLVRALYSNYIKVLGHSTDVGWRKLKIPEEYVLEVLDIVKEQNIAVEVNYHHKDPLKYFLKLCIKRGVFLTPTSDAHNLSEIGHLDWHLKYIASLGLGNVKWLTPEDILNSSH